MRNDVITKVKVAVAVEEKDTPCWPCINYDFDKELSRVMEPVTQMNPEIQFDVVKYTDREQAEKDYDSDLEKYQGVLVLLMTCWKNLDVFYAEKLQEGGLPLIVADVPYCGSGSMLARTSVYMRETNAPVPIISSLDYSDIAKAVHLFRVLHLMKETTILAVSGRSRGYEDIALNTWGCKMIKKTPQEFNDYFNKIDTKEAEKVAQMWKDEAYEVLEPSDDDLIESAKVYLALEQMRTEVGAHAITVDCLNLSYFGHYDKNRHMYPCMSHFEMTKHNIVAVCEYDTDSTITSLLSLYMTGRQGYVSDPVIDTSSNQIIYAHCVACNKVFGCSDARVCKVNIRSHAEDNMGASVQFIFPAGENLTTVIMHHAEQEAAIHSAFSVGNVGGDEGCRSKLAATCEAEKILHNWVGGWHRVTVFGEYRKQFMMLFKMKGIKVIEEDR